MPTTAVAPACRPSAGALFGLKTILAALLASTFVTPAFSNDGYGELGLGGIVTLGKTYAVYMRKEVLEVSPGKIRVDYVFERNISLLTADKTFPVMFPLPLYGAETPSWSWAGSPQDFSVTVDGKRQAFKTVVKARTGRCDDGTLNRRCSTDVTKTLRAAGLSDGQIALFPGASPFTDGKGHRPNAPALTEPQKRQLINDKLLDEEGIVSPYPNWLADVTYIWEMAFNGRKSIDVSHEYVPFTSGGSSSYYFTEDMLRNDYCADDSLISAWQKLVAAAPPNPMGYGPVPGRRVEYILTTANSWGGPISDFTLRLKKAKPTELVLLCFPGKVRKVDPLTLEVKLKEFEPRNELRVLFLNVDDAHGRDGKPPAGVPPVIAH